MSAEVVARTIQLILAPVVMVTACAMLANGILSRYSAVNDRVRRLTRERLELVKAGPAEGVAGDRLQEIDVQIPDLLHHYKMLHDAVLAVYAAVLCFVISMFVIAWAAATNSPWLPALVLIVFLAGTGALWLGVLLTAREVRTSHRALEIEARRVMARRE